MTQLKQGARFRCKVKGELATGTIQPMDNPKEHWYLLKPTGERWYIGDGSLNSLLYYQVTDLELLPDEEEPQKGDWVDVSDSMIEWRDGINRIYTGYYNEKYGYAVHIKGSKDIVFWKHIRKAPSPDQVKRQEAERKADKHFNDTGLVCNPTQYNAVVEYILTQL